MILDAIIQHCILMVMILIIIYIIAFSFIR